VACKNTLKLSAAATLPQVDPAIDPHGLTNYFLEKTARNRHFIETLLPEYDIGMLEKLFK
jgi:hypothetical protein